MQFTICREPLLKLMRTVSGVVERRGSQLPILANVLLQITEAGVINVTGTDQEVELHVKDELIEDFTPGEITFSLRKFNDICRALPEKSQVTVELKGERLVVLCGRGRFSLSTLPADEFPQVNKSKTEPGEQGRFVVAKKQLKLLLSRTAFAIAEQDVRYFLNGLLLEVEQKNNAITAVATDGHRLAKYSVSLDSEIKGEVVRAIIPRKGVLEITRILDDIDSISVEVVLSAGFVSVRGGNTVVTAKLLAGKFPDYKKVIPQAGGRVLVGSRKALKEAFTRASALFNEKFRGVRLRLSANDVKISANNPEQDEAEEDLSDVAYSGDDMEIGFNVRYLLDFLGALPTEEVQFTFSDSNNSALVQGVGAEQDAVYILMPMRI